MPRLHRAGVPALLLFSLTLGSLAACGGADAGNAEAKARGDNGTSGEGAQGQPAARAEPALTAQDSATRTVARALAQAGGAGALAASATDVRELAAAAADTASADTAGGDTMKPAGPAAPKYRAGESPAFAAKNGWPVKGPRPLPGAIMPNKRVVCYYGNPKSKKMGALGEFPKEEMLRRLDRAVADWTRADPSTPALPCLHMVTVVAQGDPGPSGKYRTQMRDSLVNEIYGWAKSRNGIFFIDVQVGQDDIRTFVPKFETFLRNPDIHFAVDPEFYMRGGVKPGAKIGTMYASDINYVTGELARIVRENKLPPKILVIHRFTRNMVQGTKEIILRPEVQIVMDMDGWGAPWLKRDSYRDYIVKEPVQYTGFKLFYGNDTKKGDPLMSPMEVLKLRPQPLYIQYQ